MPSALQAGHDTIGYPGGVTASYTHDFADREVSLEVTTPEGTETVVSAATYLPGGPLSSLALGNGVTETRAFDGRYAPVRIGVSGDPVGAEVLRPPALLPGPPHPAGNCRRAS